MTASAYIARATGQRRRRRALPLPASTIPHDCVRLCVDTAANSGWCIGAGPRAVLRSGEVKALNHAELIRIIQFALSCAVSSGFRSPERHVVLVLEKAWRGPPRGNAAKRNQYAVQSGLGAARGMWLSAWCEVMGTTTPRRVVQVYPQEWRRKVIVAVGGELLPALEKAAAEKLRGKSDLEPTVIGKDEAAAICMSAWAMKAGEVLKVLPKPRKPRKAKAA